MLLHLIALGVGSLIQLVLALATDGIFEATELSEVIKPLPDDSPWRSIVTKMSPLLYIALWVIRWFIGLWWALEIRSWLLSLWPHIELDVGTEHLKIEKMQRHRLMTVITVIVLPIATSMIYDLIKFAF